MFVCASFGFDQLYQSQWVKMNILIIDFVFIFFFRNSNSIIDRDTNIIRLKKRFEIEQNTNIVLHCPKIHQMVTTNALKTASSMENNREVNRKPKKVIHYYRKPGFTAPHNAATLRRLQRNVSSSISSIDTEFCFNIEITSELTVKEVGILEWILRETFEPDMLAKTTHLVSKSNCSYTIELGPRLNFCTAYSSNAVSILHGCGIEKVTRLERSRRYRIITKSGTILTNSEKSKVAAALHDRMTECIFEKTLTSFDNGVCPKPTQTIPIMSEGRAALEKINAELGLSFDEWDLEFYTNLFVKELARNPTDVECFDMAQSNSEHSRHWFFGGRMIIDGVEQPISLFKMVKDTLNGERSTTNKNSVIAFHDNSCMYYFFFCMKFFL